MTIAALAAAVALTAVYSPVLAQQRNAGDKIVYTFTQSGSGGKMNGKFATTFTFAIDGTDADGNAHATTSVQMQGLPKGQNTSFEATISPTGAIVPKSDMNMKPSMGMSQKQAEALAGNELAVQLQMQLSMMNFNAFADTCAKRKLQTGDTWQAPMENRPMDTVVYTVTGSQTQQGRDTFAVTMKMAPGSADSLTGQGFYDPAAHLVVGMHTEAGMPGQNESLVSDMTLSP